jgi:hypothetical protein
MPVAFSKVGWRSHSIVLGSDAFWVRAPARTLAKDSVEVNHTFGSPAAARRSLRAVRRRHKHGRHPEEVTRSLLRVTVSKDGRGEQRRWPSHIASKTCVNALIEDGARGRRLP